MTMEKIYAFIFVLNCFLNIHPGARAIGINYGLNGDDLPSPSDAISLLQSRNISKVRLFEPNSVVLTALKDSGIDVILGTENQNLQSFASDPSTATSWVNTNVVPYASSLNFEYIAVGNEVIPGDLAQYVPSAMQNIDAALFAAGFAIPVSHAVSMSIMGPSFPPSNGVFSTEATPIMTEILKFLSSKNSSLLVNAYTWFPRQSDPNNVQLEYALIDDAAKPVTDNSLIYQNLFDAMVDTVYAGMEKVGVSNVDIVVAETGWPTAGSTDATIENAQKFNNNLIKLLASGKGTPRKPGKVVEAYIFALFNENLKPEGAWAIGVNYGLNGDNLPSPSDVVSLLKSRKIQKIRLFEPNAAVLTALQGSGISVILGTENQNLQSFALDPSAAASWVATNIIPYALSVNFVHVGVVNGAVGNDAIPGTLAQYGPSAMQNIDTAIFAAGFAVPVSTAVSMQILGPSFPPSNGVFSAEATPIMTQILTFLSSKNYPLLLNVYTWFPRLDDPNNVHLDYALLEDTATPVPDNSLIYQNLFDAMVDTVYAAMEKVGVSNVDIVVAETGWPSAGNIDATVENAQRYNNNLIKLLASGKGTPRKPGKVVEAYIFALFNENLKPEGVEQNWGLFYPNMAEVYHVDF
ncbi:hypothetical protein RD792_005364 [Penstemon davidsonii]|uniref:Glucan endo-1,3-beta-D-glucosidase n=1 Tax=Penstemon davidsonii TaxID=160366 RepID=A0ABR0DJY7_9LAMI|nr:hypothetical protein RD792_005364 [Penstemon davidsonii]